MAADPIVVELVGDSKLLSGYYRRVGDNKSSDILSLISAVEAKGLDTVTIADPAVIALNIFFAGEMSAAPRLALQNLRLSGGAYLRPGWRRNLWLGILVLVAVGAMTIVGQLTHIYNRGVALVGELEALEAQKPLQQYGILERNLVYSQHLLSKETAAGGNETDPSGLPVSTTQIAPDTLDPVQGPFAPKTDEYRLAQEASQQFLVDLTELDAKIAALEIASRNYQEDASYPIIGSRTFSAWLDRTSAYLACRIASGFQNEVPSDQKPIETQSPANCGNYQPSAPMSIYAVRGAGMRPTYCTQPNDGKSPIQVAAAQDRFGISLNDIIMTNCNVGLTYISDTIPFVSSLLNPVRSIVSVYSFLVLPSLFGAFGALMYYMRRVLDPQTIDPPFIRTLHRIALGALSGLVIAWLWNGMFSGSEDLRAIGLGVFVIAFVFGFSIDVFFALLDRLVKLSTNAVNRLGEA